MKIGFEKSIFPIKNTCPKICPFGDPSGQAKWANNKKGKIIKSPINELLLILSIDY